MPAKKQLDPALRAYLDEQSAASPGPIRSAADARSRMERQLQGRTIPGLPNGVSTEEFSTPGGVRTRVYLPPLPLPQLFPMLVYLHGGGWVAGSIETHDPFCRLLSAQAGTSIVSVDYRRAPESPYPAALEDARQALLWAAENAGNWGADPQKLALGGDSSGGNLAAVLANQLASEPGAPPLRALLLLYPVTDHPSARHPSYAENATGYGLLAASMEWYWNQYAAAVSPDNPAVSPLRAPTLPQLPPTLVATAEYDVLRDEGIAYARKLAEAGVEVRHIHAPDMHHDFPVSPGTVARFRQCDETLGEVARWLRDALTSKDSLIPSGQ